MRIILNQRFIDQLLELPESGMGYQRVDIFFTNGRLLRDVVVFNAQECNVPSQFVGSEINRITLHSLNSKGSMSEGTL